MKSDPFLRSLPTKIIWVSIFGKTIQSWFAWLISFTSSLWHVQFGRLVFQNSLKNLIKSAKSEFQKICILWKINKFHGHEPWHVSWLRMVSSLGLKRCELGMPRKRSLFHAVSPGSNHVLISQISEIMYFFKISSDSYRSNAQRTVRFISAFVALFLFTKYQTKNPRIPLYIPLVVLKLQLLSTMEQVLYI